MSQFLNSLLSISPAAIDPKITVSIEKNVFEYNNKWYVIYKKCDNMNNQVIENLSPLLVLDNPDNNNLDTGVYVWVIATDKDDNIHLYAKKTLFLQEIQTKHNNLVYDLQNNKLPNIRFNELYYAGELQINNEEELKKLNFNFLSGSYMLGRTPDTPELREIVLEFFKSKFPNYETTYDDTNKTFITPETFKMDDERFNLLKQVCPGNIYVFDNNNDAISFSNLLLNNAKQDAAIQMKKIFLKSPIYKEEKYQTQLTNDIEALQKGIRTIESYEDNKLDNVENPSKRRKLMIGGKKNKQNLRNTHKKSKRLRKMKTKRNK